MMRHGVAMAHRAGLTNAGLLNTRAWTGLSAWLSHPRRLSPASPPAPMS